MVTGIDKNTLLPSSGRGVPLGGTPFNGVADHATFTGADDPGLAVPAEEKCVTL